MRSFIHRHMIVPGFETLIKRRKIYRYWDELERTQWQPRTELTNIQLLALRRLLSHAEANCPYYREIWKRHGLKPDDVQSLDDFQNWPVTRREDIRNHRPMMRAEAPPMKLIEKATGGSSGAPLIFDLDENSNDRRVAATFRGYNWAGAAPGTRQLYLWGVPLGQRPRIKVVKDRLYEYLYHRLVLNSFELSEERLLEFLGRFERYRPEVVIAYTNPLYYFAKAIEERGLTPPKPRSLIVGAEKLYDYQRETIERVFGAPVFETYGSREFMLIGAECEQHKGLHISHEHLVVEVLDDEGRSVADDQEGDVVITDLYNYGMPFIRYPTGDRAIVDHGTCVCRRTLPLLKRIVGRRLDILLTPDGRQIPGEFFPHLLKDYPVSRFQVVQEERRRISIKIVPGCSWNAGHCQRVLSQARQILGDEVALELVVVGEINLSRAGKLQVVVNKCEDSP